MKIFYRIRKTVLLLMIAAAFVLLPTCRTEAATNYIAQAKKNVVRNGEFVTNNKGIRYQYKNNTFAKNKWHSIDGKIYYFGSNTYVKTGWFVYQKNTYYADASGAVYASRWLTTDNARYYLKANGVRAAKEWVKKKNKYYYLDKDGGDGVRYPDLS